MAVQSLKDEGPRATFMSWQEEHKKHVAGFPANVRSAHAHSSNNRAEIADSTLCGCFYCCEMFAPGDILDWADEDPEGHGQTALCPKCGVDSVLGDKSGVEISKEFLATMKAHWF